MESSLRTAVNWGGCGGVGMTMSPLTRNSTRHLQYSVRLLQNSAQECLLRLLLSLVMVYVCESVE